MYILFLNMGICALAAKTRKTFAKSQEISHKKKREHSIMFPAYSLQTFKHDLAWHRVVTTRTMKSET